MTVQNRVRRVADQLPTLGLVAFGFSGLFQLLAEVLTVFPGLNEAGYGDSYILYDAEQFRRTGLIYRDPALPPHPPGIYSPLLYVVLSLPGRMLHTTNPFLGPRAVILLAFVGCVLVTMSIARALIRAPAAGQLALLLACAIGTMPRWVLQLRGDFPGAAFGLLAVRLLLVPRWWAMLLAGTAAGLAFQFKITFVAALAAGGLWLLAARRWWELVFFSSAGALFAVAPYLYFHFREPAMFTQLLSLSHVIRDYNGLAHLAAHAAIEPVSLIAVATLPLVWHRRRRRWSLLVLFACISLGVAVITGVHSGANQNYFFEGLFALTPLAVLGGLRLSWGGWRQGTGGRLAALLLLAYAGLPNLMNGAHTIREGLGASARRAERRPIEVLGQALPGHRVLSTVPRVSLLIDTPELIEPFQLTYLQRLGKFDTRPLRERIRRLEFEAIVTRAKPSSFRGVPSLPEDLREAIAEAYHPFCAPGPAWMVHLPNDATGRGPFATRLLALGCTAVGPDAPAL